MLRRSILVIWWKIFRTSFIQAISDIVPSFFFLFLLFLSLIITGDICHYTKKWCFLLRISSVMWPNPQEAADFVTFTKKIFNRKLNFFVKCMFLLMQGCDFKFINLKTQRTTCIPRWNDVKLPFPRRFNV